VKLARALGEEKVSVEAMPVVMAQVAMTPAVPTPGNAEASHAEGARLGPEEASALEDATLGLVALGYRKSDASPRARRALEALQARGERVTSETLLKAALR